MNIDEIRCDGRLYPVLAPGDVLHLGRAEARKKKPPQLFAVCPAGRHLGALPPAPKAKQPRRPRWLFRRRASWCADCERYGAHIAGAIAQTGQL